PLGSTEAAREPRSPTTQLKSEPGLGLALRIHAALSPGQRQREQRRCRPPCPEARRTRSGRPQSLRATDRAPSPLSTACGTVPFGRTPTQAQPTRRRGRRTVAGTLEDR